MLHSIIFAVCLTQVFMSVECFQNNTNSNIKITFVESFPEYLSANPDVTKLRLLEKRVGSKSFADGLEHINYVYGKRLNGDQQLTYSASGKSFYEPSTEKANLSFSGRGSITFVRIGIMQIGTSGDAYISSGGIGQNHISIMIVAKNTNFLSIAGNVYGYNR